MNNEDFMKQFMNGFSSENEFKVLGDALMEISKKAHNIAIGNLK